MVEFLLWFVKIGLIVVASYMGLAVACGVVFGSYFNARKKFLKEVNQIDYFMKKGDDNDQTHGS